MGQQIEQDFLVFEVAIDGRQDQLSHVIHVLELFEVEGEVLIVQRLRAQVHFQGPVLVQGLLGGKILSRNNVVKGVRADGVLLTGALGEEVGVQLYLLTLKHPTALLASLIDVAELFLLFLILRIFQEIRLGVTGDVDILVAELGERSLELEFDWSKGEGDALQMPLELPLDLPGVDIEVFLGINPLLEESLVHSFLAYFLEVFVVQIHEEPGLALQGLQIAPLLLLVPNLDLFVKLLELLLDCVHVALLRLRQLTHQLQPSLFERGLSVEKNAVLGEYYFVEILTFRKGTSLQLKARLTLGFGGNLRVLGEEF